MINTIASREALNLLNELDKIKTITNCTNEEILKFRDRAKEIADISERTTYEIISEINHLLMKYPNSNVKKIIDFVDKKYRSKRIKRLGTWTNMEEDSYMSNIKFEMYGNAASVNYHMDLLKDKNGSVKNKFNKDSIKDVIFNDPATIVLWNDGTKTVVKCQKETGDTYNPELGLAICIIKKCCDNKGNFNDVFNKWLPKESR